MNNTNSSKNILVSGANGFLGTKVVSALCAEGYNVTGIVRSMQVRSTLPEKRNLQWLVRDLSINQITTQEANCFDTIVHLAGATDRRGEDLLMHLHANEMTTIGLTMHDSKSVNKFIFASSQVVYGNPNSLSIDESFPTDSTYSNYATSKLNAENWLKIHQSKANNMVLSLRLTGFINGGGIVDTLIRDCLSGNPVELFGYGKISRDYIHSSFFINVLLRFLSLPPSCEYLTLNIGSGQALPLVQIASLIKDYTSSNSEIILSPKQAIRDNFIFNIQNLISKVGINPPPLDKAILDYLQEINIKSVC